MKNILVLTTTYPRWLNDTEPAFVHNLNIELAKQDKVFVLTPHAKNSKKKETIDEINIYRYRYFYPLSLQRLAYDGGIVPKIKSNFLYVFQIPFLCLAMLIATTRYLKTNPVDVIHAHWVLPQGLIALIAIKLSKSKARLLVTSHGADLFSLKGWLFVKLKKLVFEKADGVTVVSNAMKQFCHDALDITRNISVLSMGIDVENKFIETTPFEQRKGIVYIGRLVEKKGVDLLIDAIANFKGNYENNLQLTIVGDGLLKSQLKKQVQSLGLTDRVRFVGGVTSDQVSKYLNAAKVCVMPSRIAKSGDQEGLGLVAGEAIACGCVCIVSDLPAIKDVHSCKELQFESDNVQSLYETLNYVFNNEQQAKSYSNELKSRVINTFSWTEVGSKYKKVIDSL